MGDAADRDFFRGKEEFEIKDMQEKGSGINPRGGIVEPVTVDEADYVEATESYTGWCTHCKDFTRSNVEPDAMEYDCPCCNQKTVMGAEQALLSGNITF